MTTIYFDESGNTGRQLADLDQPLFILGCKQNFCKSRANDGKPSIQIVQLRKSEFLFILCIQV